MDKKKYFSILIIFLLCFTVFPGYVFPEGTPHVTADTSIGNITVYFPASANGLLYYSESDELLINTSGSSMSGYFILNGDEFTMRFPSYNVPNYSVSYNSFQVTDWHNVEFNNLNPYSSGSYYFETSLLIIIAFFIFFIFLKR